MADLNSIIAEVVGLTNRPDMIAETTSAVKSATLRAHRSDFYWKDLFESNIVYATADYTQSIDYRSIIPNFRSMKYLRKFDFGTNYQNCQQNNGFQGASYNTNGTQCPGKFFELITPEQALDSYNLQRRDVYYMAGNLIQVKSSTLTEYALFGCYLNPIVGSEATYSSWIATDHEYAIVFQAVSQIYGLLENTNAQATYQKLADAEIAMLIASNITGEGF